MGVSDPSLVGTGIGKTGSCLSRLLLAGWLARARGGTLVWWRVDVFVSLCWLRGLRSLSVLGGLVVQLAGWLVLCFWCMREKHGELDGLVGWWVAVLIMMFPM